MREEIERTLETLRPRLRMDGGDLELVEITPEQVVRIRLTGACDGCPFSTMTLRALIESELRAAVPGIRGVESVS